MEVKHYKFTGFLSESALVMTGSYYHLLVKNLLLRNDVIRIGIDSINLHSKIYNVNDFKTYEFNAWGTLSFFNNGRSENIAPIKLQGTDQFYSSPILYISKNRNVYENVMINIFNTALTVDLTLNWQVVPYYVGDFASGSFAFATGASMPNRVDYSIEFFGWYEIGI